MLVEPHAPAHSTAWDFIPNAFPALDQSNVPGDPLHLLASGRESLAASPDAAVLQKRPPRSPASGPRSIT